MFLQQFNSSLRTNDRMRSGLSRTKRISTKIVKHIWLCDVYIISCLLSRIWLATPALFSQLPIELAVAVNDTNTPKVGVSTCSYWSSQFHKMYSSYSRTRRGIREVQPPIWIFGSFLIVRLHKHTVQALQLS